MLQCAFVYILGCQVLSSYFLSLSDFPTLFWAHLTLMWLSGYFGPVNVPVCARVSPEPCQSCVTFYWLLRCSRVCVWLEPFGIYFWKCFDFGFLTILPWVCSLPWLFAEKLLNFCDVWTALSASGSFSTEILRETLKMFPTFSFVSLPNQCLHHTSDFLYSPKQFSVTINTGLVSLMPINRLWCSQTNQRSARSTPSHIIISVTDLEVKFNFPLQWRCPSSSLKNPLVNSEAISSTQHRQDRILYLIKKGYEEQRIPRERQGIWGGNYSGVLWTVKERLALVLEKQFLISRLADFQFQLGFTADYESLSWEASAAEGQQRGPVEGILLGGVGTG